MIQKYVYGAPFSTDAVTADVPEGTGAFPCGTVTTDEGFCFTYVMDDEDIVYGLGEENRALPIPSRRAASAARIMIPPCRKI